MAFGEQILIRMGLDTGAVQRGFHKIAQQSDGFTAKIKRSFAGIGAQIGAAFTIGGLVAAGRSLKEFADQIKTTADITGVSTDFLQGFQHAAEQNSSSAEKAAKALEKLNIAIGQARDGNKQAVETFKGLNVNLDTSTGAAQSTEAIILQLADRFAGMKYPTERAAAALALFGKGGASMIPVLSQGAEGLRKLIAEAKKLSPEDAKTIDQLNDSIEALTRSFQVGLGTIVAYWAEFNSGANKAKKALGWQPPKWEPPWEWGRSLGRAFAFPAGSKIDDTPMEPSEERIARLTKAGRIPETSERQAQIEETLKAQGALESRLQKFMFDKLNDNEKLNDLKIKGLLIDKQIAGLQEGSAERLKLEKDRIDNTQAVLDLENKIADRKQKQADSQRDEFFKKQDKITAAFADKESAVTSLADAKAARGHFSLEELADINIGRNTTGEQRRNILSARQVKFLEGDARFADRLGNVDFANKQRARADEIRGGITSLNLDERFPFASYAIRTTTALETLSDLATKKGGLPVRATFGK